MKSRSWPIALLSAFLIFRWWKTETRYKTTLSGKLVGSSKSSSCKILNLSYGGAFIQTPVHLKSNSVLKLKFHGYEQDFLIRVRVAHFKPGKNGGYGLQFVHNKQTAVKIKQLMKVFEFMGLDTSRDIEPWQKNMRTWMRTLALTGDGFVPEMPKNYSRKKAA